MTKYQTISKHLLWIVVAMPLLASGCYATVRARPGVYAERDVYAEPYYEHRYYAPPRPRAVVVVPERRGHWEERRRDSYRAPRVVVRRERHDRHDRHRD